MSRGAMSDSLTLVALTESVALGVVAGALGSIGSWGGLEYAANIALICALMWLLFAQGEPRPN
jgi:uncharacterized membrane protein